MPLRIWHSSRDAYHCAFRLHRLLSESPESRLDLERARILDLFVLFPSLLHRTHMPMEVRARFRALEIPRPETDFINLPSAAVLFQDLRVYQNVAVAHLVAKGIIEREPLVQSSVLVLRRDAVPAEMREMATARNASDEGLIKFLIQDWSLIPLRGPRSIYRSVGLPERAIAA